MSSRISQFVDESFKKLVEEFGFRKTEELDEGQSYNVKFQSDAIIIEIEKYFREFYDNVSGIDDPDAGVAVYNLLSYLMRESGNAPPQPNYFKEEKNLDDCFRKQLNYIAQTILTNLEAITGFFKNEKYKEERIKLHNYLKEKNPQLYDTI